MSRRGRFRSWPGALAIAVLLLPGMALAQQTAPVRASVELGERDTSSERSETDASSARVRAAVAGEARRHRNIRIGAGVVSLVNGVAAISGGYYLVATAKPTGFIDFSEVQKGIGWTFVGLGAVSLLVSPLALRDSPAERRQAKLSRAIKAGDGAAGIAHARLSLEAEAARAGRSRRIIGIVGVTLLGVGGISLGTLAVVHEDVSDGQLLALSGGAFAGFLVGGASVITAMIETPIERAVRKLGPRAEVHGIRIAPGRGGGLLVLDGSF